MRVFNLWLLVFFKQLSIEKTYKTSFFLQFLSIPITILSWFFLSKLIDTNSPFLNQDYSYLVFVIIGVASLDLCISIINYVLIRLREEQISGVLEEIFVANTSVHKYIFALTSYPTVLSLIRLSIYMLILFFISSSSFSLTNLLLALPVIFLSILSVTGFCMAAAALVLLIKKGGFLSRGFITISSLCGGVIYPINLLPTDIQFISNIIPVTQLANSLRQSFIGGFAPDIIVYDLVHQFFLALIYISIGSISLSYMIDKILRDKSLADF